MNENDASTTKLTVTATLAALSIMCWLVTDCSKANHQLQYQSQIGERAAAAEKGKLPATRSNMDCSEIKNTVLKATVKDCYQVFQRDLKYGDTTPAQVLILCENHVKGMLCKEKP